MKPTGSRPMSMEAGCTKSCQSQQRTCTVSGRRWSICTIGRVVMACLLKNDKPLSTEKKRPPRKRDTSVHEKLVSRACRWLKNTVGCGVVLSELSTHAGQEPDAIGFRCDGSFLVECKTSRADFFRDKKKIWMRFEDMSMGRWRYYMTPPGLISPDDLPPKWGLLEFDGRKVARIVGRTPPPAYRDSLEWQCEADVQKEWLLLVSALRRSQEK